MLNIFENWKLIMGAIIAVPVIFWLGTVYGAISEKSRIEVETLISSAKNDVATLGAISLVKKEYEPIYLEVEKYVEVPVCPVPAVIADTVKRLYHR